MLRRSEYLVLTGIALLIVCLVLANVVLVLSNRSTQTDAQARAQFIQQSAQLEVLYREIVKALADLAVKNQDADVRALLGNHGITVTVNPGAPTAAPGAAVPGTAEPMRKAGGK